MSEKTLDADVVVEGLPRLIRNELCRGRRIDDFKQVDWLYSGP